MSPQPTIVLLGGTPRLRGELAQALESLAAKVDSSVHIRQQALPDAVESGPSLPLLLHPSDDGAQWRAQLTAQGLGYSVLHGDAQSQLKAAWALAAPFMGLTQAQAAAVMPAEPEGRTARLGTSWRCEKCSDPECEHRLFRDLIAGREGNALRITD